MWFVARSVECRLGSGNLDGQGALRSRTTARRMDAASSIVHQMLTQREHSGRNLGVLVHQHFGYRVHYTWEGTFGSRSFERRFESYDSVSDFCSTVETGTPEGLCSCVIARGGSLGSLEQCSICCIPRQHYV
jgi:hypothetical protein